MKKCYELLLEYGVDYLDKQRIPENVELHFKSCKFCLKELEKQGKISKFLDNILLKEEEIPKIYLPPVIRKKEKIQFLSLSVVFFLFFLFFHSILNFEFLKPYFLIFSNLKLIPFIELNLKGFFFITIVFSLIFVIVYQIRRFLKKI